jgi:toxin ParE1/3/4
MTSLLLEFHPEAESEADAALYWYAQRSRTAALAFLDEIDHALAMICENPDRWPLHGHGTRRYLMHAFPYLIVYRRLDDRIQIVAVAHGARRPKYWPKRLT